MSRARSGRRALSAARRAQPSATATGRAPSTRGSRPLELKIPKLRNGSYFPAFLEPRRTAEQALVAVIQEAWIKGVSTRKVDDLVQAMGMSGISKSQVSDLCAGHRPSTSSG